MDRLTWEYKDGGMFVNETEVKTYECDDVLMHTGNAIIKLSKYEDTGMTPEEILQLKKSIKIIFKDFPKSFWEGINEMPNSAFSVNKQ